MWRDVYMDSKIVIIDNKKGLQSRMATKLVKKAMSFKSDIIVECNGITADAKSIINVLALQVPYQSKVTITAIGPDETLAVNELVHFVNPKS